ncbi:MAG TPA: signal peptidase I [Candidatus Acidoferrales bacterium]|nr:signal peptidase I [Candidatus Acidoferrales bacterium]
MGSQTGQTVSEADNNNRTSNSDRWRSGFLRELLSWFWVILAFFLIEGSVVQARVIPSGSMEKTILPGDHVLVTCFGYDAGVPFTDYHVPLWREPKRKQIVVFPAPFPGHPDLIKRIVGMPGDHLKIVNGQVFVNGAPLNEPYAYHDPSLAAAFMDNFPPAADSRAAQSQLTPAWAAELSKDIDDGTVVVPPREYFVMGDNRENSYDSRFWGFVPRASIIGTPAMIYMSIKAPEEVWDPRHIGERFETYLRVFVHPSEVRWKRLFRTF